MDVHAVAQTVPWWGYLIGGGLLVICLTIIIVVVIMTRSMREMTKDL